ncbi:MAG: hypothetical protein FWC78_03040 [Defluviitaleaceae bacterium]|nr:hypothetical protein [Defluviitaleaceae bacterium]
MIYPHQQLAIDYITAKMQQQSHVQALLVYGSIMHGFNDEASDVDVCAVVSEAIYQQKREAGALTFYEEAGQFYDGGYFDGKYVSLEYLAAVAQRGNEPTRFALHNALVAFDNTGQVAGLLKKIGEYDATLAQENAIRFLSQLEGWRWYCKEAVAKSNLYLLEVAVSRLVLFAGRLILLDNLVFFPYHKWFMKALEGCKSKPVGIMAAIDALLAEKSMENVTRLYDMVKGHRDWAAGREFSWNTYFVHDVETVWIRQDEFVENL